MAYYCISLMSLEETLSPITNGELSLTLSSYSCQSKLVRNALKFVPSTERALPNCTPSHSQPLSPTPANFSRKTTHSDPFVDKNDPLLSIFQQKQHTTTHFLTISTNSHPFFKNKNPLHPFFDKGDPLLPIFRQKRHTPIHFSTNGSHSHPIFKKNGLLQPIF